MCLPKLQLVVLVPIRKFHFELEKKAIQNLSNSQIIIININLIASCQIVLLHLEDSFLQEVREMLLHL